MWVDGECAWSVSSSTRLPFLPGATARVSPSAGSATRALESKQRSIFGGGSTRPISPCVAERLEGAPTVSSSGLSGLYRPRSGVASRSLCRERAPSAEAGRRTVTPGSREARASTAVALALLLSFSCRKVASAASASAPASRSPTRPPPSRRTTSRWPPFASTATTTRCSGKTPIRWHAYERAYAAPAPLACEQKPTSVSPTPAGLTGEHPVARTPLFPVRLIVQLGRT
jgi:hypothetical protein